MVLHCVFIRSSKVSIIANGHFTFGNTSFTITKLHKNANGITSINVQAPQLIGDSMLKLVYNRHDINGFFKSSINTTNPITKKIGVNITDFFNAMEIDLFGYRRK